MTGRRVMLAAATAAVLTAVFFLCLNPIAATDFWWQAKTGELIVRQGIPHRDPFGWTSGGAPWLVHEWLTEVFFYLALTRLGEWSLVLYKAGLGVLALTLVLVRAWRRSDSLPLALGVTLLAALVVRNYADLRPQMVTFLLLAGMLAALDEYRTGRMLRLPWVLPVLFALWANLHGGVVVGLALGAIWTAGEVIGAACGRPSPGTRALALGVAASALAACFNPNGWQVYRYPFEVLGHPEVRDYITEWWSPNFHYPAQRWFEVLLLLTPAAYAAHAWRGEGDQSRPSLGELGVLLAMAHAALIAQRNTAPFALAAAPLVAEGAALWWRRLECPFAAWKKTRFAGALGAGVTLALALAVAFGAAPREDGRRPWWQRRMVPPERWYAYGTSLDDFPREAVELMKQGEWPGRLYNDYVWGGYLIWELYPKRQVFVDGRAEVYYPSRAFDDEMAIHQVREGWDTVLARRGVEVVLTHRSGALSRALRRHAGWELAFTGPVEAVYRLRQPGDARSAP